LLSLDSQGGGEVVHKVIRRLVCESGALVLLFAMLRMQSLYIAARV